MNKSKLQKTDLQQLLCVVILCCICSIIQPSFANFNPTLSVNCISSTALEVEVRDCVPDALVYVVNCTIRTCTTSNLTFTVDTVSDCEPDLDSSSTNNYTFLLVAQEFNFFRPQNDSAFDGTCPDGTLVKRTSFPLYDSLSTIATIQDVVEPDITMEISKAGSPVTSATIGDNLDLTIRVGQDFIDTFSYDIIVDNCTANSIQIFTDGCPVSPFVPNEFTDISLGLIEVNFDAFMDVTLQRYLKFACTLDVCVGPCPSPTCSRVKRNADVDHNSTNSSPFRRYYTTQTSIDIISSFLVATNGGPGVLTIPLETTNTEYNRMKQLDNGDDSAYLVATGVLISLLYLGIFGMYIFLCYQKKRKT